MQVLIKIDEARFNDIQRIAEVQLDRRTDTVEQLIANGTPIPDNATNICGDNRFEIIAKAKEDIISATNIEDAKDEMECLDSFLFRCWQMGWLDKYEPYQKGGK